jgi:hypothetical protein
MILIIETMSAQHRKQKCLNTTLLKTSSAVTLQSFPFWLLRTKSHCQQCVNAFAYFVCESIHKIIASQSDFFVFEHYNAKKMRKCRYRAPFVG